MSPARRTGDGPADGVPGELGRLLGEALRCLEGTDLDGANTALRRAHAEARGVDTSGTTQRHRHRRGERKEDDRTERPASGQVLGVETAEIGRSGSRLVLRGEFDWAILAELRAALGAMPYPGPTLVDLSGVTFMDSSCVRELASWRLLHAGLAGLATPSWQARASFSACGISGGPGPPPRTRDLPEPSGATG